MADIAQPAYRVLARKYRPATFADLVGQEALVRTLTNAIGTGRLAHAFVLTGVRGVGKTTTARIIARALSCVGKDGKGGPTADPCGVCQNCVAIAEDRHVDVIEMDAASHNGIEDVRQITDSVRYSPVMGRFKIFILDEAHMLSKPAFNALLKTLEEPPGYVKFIFATTEIRKMPVTVLSRCQRFDLRRLDAGALAKHLAGVAAKEKRKLTEGAARLLARAADGSARDGLSLLDRALAHIDGEIGEPALRDLLGLADRTQVFDLFEHAMAGRAADALAQIAEMYRGGADPLVVVQDLLEVSHLLTRLQAAPALAEDAALPEAERARGLALAGKLAVPALARAWTMLLKGLGEVQAAPQPLAALEMLLVRLAYAAELPDPATLVRQLQDGGGTAAPGPRGNGGAPAPRGGVRAIAGGAPAAVGQALAAEPVADPAVRALADPRSFRAVVELFAAKREGILQALLWSNVHLLRFEPGLIEMRAPDCPRDFASKLIDLLARWTGRPWRIALATDGGEATLAQQATQAAAVAKEAAAAHPLVQAALAAFPGSTLEVVRGPAGEAAAPAAPASEADGAGDEPPPPDLDLIPDTGFPEDDEA